MRRSDARDRRLPQGSVCEGWYGQRGGARIVYIVRRDDIPMFLVAAYAKNAKDNLSKDERNQLAKRADELFDSYRRKR